MTDEKLRMIEAPNRCFATLGFRVCRVRHHDDLARVELGRDELARAVHPDVRLHRPRSQGGGYRYVTVDPRGYRTGSLNEGLLLRPA